MSDRQWATLSRLRVFRTQEETEARARIDALIRDFRLFQIDREKIPEYRKTMNATLIALEDLQDRITEMERLSQETNIQLTEGWTMVKHAHSSLISKNSIEGLRTALNVAGDEVRRGLSDLGTDGRGPDNDDAYDFVELLNKIVLDRSDGGPLTRSDKNVAGKGNDVQFVTEVLSMATRFTHRSIGSGTIIEAIRHLKDVARENPMTRCG